MNLRTHIRFLFTLSALTVCALQTPAEALWPVGQHTASVGPQIYQLKRVREGGTHQKGIMYGVRGVCERTEPNSLYWGVEGNWAKGTLEGTTGTGRALKSNMTESIAEGRLGWTFEGQLWTYFSFTPFAGIGYYEGENRFVPPTALTIRFTDTFAYFTAGFQSAFWVNDLFSVGLNIRAQDMYEGNDRISDDPDNPAFSTRIEDERHWVIETPLNCYPTFCGRCVEISLTPFYQYRHFGGREGIFDFLDTKFYILGARLTIGTAF
ncbi:MAG: hypothetical protein Q8K75_07515 [Chlamydiales bacterium]|nr:hypothetical protein [Chlamydiales bacterium]